MMRSRRGSYHHIIHAYHKMYTCTGARMWLTGGFLPQGGIKKGYKTGVTFTGGYGDHHVRHNAESAPFVKFWSTAKMGTPNVVRHAMCIHTMYLCASMRPQVYNIYTHTYTYMHMCACACIYWLCLLPQAQWFDFYPQEIVSEKDFLNGCCSPPYTEACPTSSRGRGCIPSDRCMHSLEVGSFVAGKSTMIMYGGLDNRYGAVCMIVYEVWIIGMLSFVWIRVW